MKPTTAIASFAVELGDEPWLVGVERRQREADDQGGDVVAPVLRDGKQKLRDPAPGFVVEAPEESEVEQREPAVVREQHVSAMGVGVVEAFRRDLPDVRTKELTCESGCMLELEAVGGPDLAPLDVPAERGYGRGDVANEFEFLAGREVEQIWVWGPFRLVFDLGTGPEDTIDVDAQDAVFSTPDGTPSRIEILDNPEFGRRPIERSPQTRRRRLGRRRGAVDLIRRRCGAPGYTGRAP